ncbi:RsmE family RNA methyltransferase [Allorhodopirellula heiligendammensis]|uniref:Ribosomal RNA small subunit methyltransferase E n=1 Tax=Allorhodopirellula heiligendammensis TaxID=2714739 RepID=A0A5C6BY79_9BACT|nr:RsmE family RNA methyltransferase [Allorhodopirellula heiligendammensis]TWU15804.1 Ribosomal RNA small subunit methyltransferase E [Allorhodopirellula heiligendammensis]
MTRRYYVPDLVTQHPLIQLPAEEAAHAVKVMRLRVGDAVELFDGRGYQAAATVTAVDRRQCECQSESPQRVNREASRHLELAIALPKPERCKEMIERLTELGIASIVPLTFERTQRPPSSSLIGKLERIVIEACKQSSRNQLMTIAPVVSFAQWIDQPAVPRLAPNETSLRLVAMPGGGPLGEMSASMPANLSCVIGPEGGLTDHELNACLDAGMQPIDLGKRILRIETAACVVAARLLDD